MKVLALFAAALLCRASMSSASECDADATSLMQVRTNLELGRERNQTEDAIELESVKAKSTSTVLDAQELKYNAVSNEKAAKAAYQDAVWAARRAAAKLKTTQQQADSAVSATDAAQRKKFQLDMEAKRANSTAELASSAFLRANASAIAATAKADAAADLSSAKEKAARIALDAQADAKENYNGVKAKAKIDKTMLDYQVDKATAAVQQNASDLAREYADNMTAASLNASWGLGNASQNLSDANALKHDAIRQSSRADGKAMHAANQAQKWDRKSVAANIDPSVNVDTVGAVSYETQTTQTTVLG